MARVVFIEHEFRSLRMGIFLVRGWSRTEVVILMGCLLEHLGRFLLLFLSSRESGIYRGEGRRFRILDSQRLPFGASWTLLVSLSSRESGICDERVEGLKILDSQGLCLQEHFVRFSLRESGIRG